jgi:hypothetical protein
MTSGEGEDAAVVSLAERRDRTLRVNRSYPTARECQHAHMEVDTRRRTLKCADCGEPVNPMDYLVDLANSEERQFRHDEAARDLHNEVAEVLAWAGEVVISESGTTARAVGRNGQRFEVKRTGGLGLFAQVIDACREVTAQRKTWGESEAAYPRFTVCPLRNRERRGWYEVGLLQKGGSWCSIDRLSGYVPAIRVAEAKAKELGCPMILEDRPRRLWGK